MEGVDRIDIDYEAKTATVRMKGDVALTKEGVEKAFKGTSYGVTSVTKKG